VAYFAERKELQGKSIVSNPYIYSLLSGSVLHFMDLYGSVGRAANSGLSFLTTYIVHAHGRFWWVVLRKIVFLSQGEPITTISDFISSVTGSPWVFSVLVTIVAVIGITPSRSPAKAIMTTLFALGQARRDHFAGWFISLAPGVFAVISAPADLTLPSARRPGFAVAFGVSDQTGPFLLVGFFWTYGLFNGFGDIVERIMKTTFAPLTKIGAGSPVSGP